MSKLISRFEIGLDNDAKATINDLKAKIDGLAHELSAKNDTHADRLLAAMQADAANDEPVTYVPWENDLNRATVNDVDYLSSDLDECVPHIDDVLDQSDVLSESVPQITQADMQLIFIKNLSECLIQRMHSMDRFSDDDYAIGGDKLMVWDIVFCECVNAYGVLTSSYPLAHGADLLFFWDGYTKSDEGWDTKSDAFRELRTITEAELPAFRAALEACHA